MNAISIKDVTKKFRIYHDKPSTLKDIMLFKKRTEWEEFWALRGINLDIEKGSSIGLIGRNGSGKSTLLKLITKIMYPDTGNIKVEGKISSLLELGAGFHPDFTGRENIYTNASIYGLTKKDIDSRMEDIIGFSEIEDFIDNPVRTYSSGMYMRLAFSVAINVNPEILIIDEILAVGDVNFQKKCVNKMKEFQQKGVTMVIVSHDTSTILNMCDTVCWLDKGIVIDSGSPERVVRAYADYMELKESSSVEKSNNHRL